MKFQLYAVRITVFLTIVYIITCRVCVWLIDGFWIRSFDLLKTYTHNPGLQAITEPSLSPHFTVHCYTRTRVVNLHSRILATDLQKSYCHIKSYIKLSLHRLVPFFHYSAAAKSEGSAQFHSSAPKQGGVSNIDKHFPTDFFYINTLHGPSRKHSLSIVGKACLQGRFITTEVTLLLLTYSLPR
jgi:hypothetical protein